MCTKVDPRDVVTTGDKRPTAKRNGPEQINANDVPLGQGLAGQARSAILTRRERIRIAVEGS